MNTTSVSLLEQLRDRTNQQAWTRFVNLYTRLLYRWVQQTGFCKQDADDLLQELFVTLFKEMPRFIYDQSKTFRGWLRTVAHNKWRDFKHRKQIPTEPLTLSEIVDDTLPDPAERFWEVEYRQHLSQQAFLLLQAEFSEPMRQAFWQVVVEGRPTSEVAAEQGRTIGAIHVSNLRIRNRLRVVLDGMLD